MRMTRLALAPAALVICLACGGKHDSTAPEPPAARMDAEEALEYSAVFLAVENELNSEEAMPMVTQTGDAYSVSGGELPACVTRTVIDPTTIKFHYVNCIGPRGGTMNGDIIVSWTANRDHFSKTYQQFVIARSGKTWTLNGTKKVDLDRTAKQSHVTAENFHKVWSDGTTTKDFHYTCNLWADWATQGSYKLYGNWGLEASGQPAIQVSVDRKTPLVWQAGCCHPISGTKEITRGSEKATLVFGPACGQVTVNGTAKQLAACN